MKDWIKYLIDFSKKFKAYWLLLLGVTIFQSFITVAVPFLTKIEMDQLVNKHDYIYFFKWNPFNLFLLIVCVLVFASLMNRTTYLLFNWIKDHYWKKFEAAFKSELFERMNNIKPGFFLSKRNTYFFRELRSTGEIIENFVNFICELARIIFESVWIFIVFSFFDYRIWITLVFIAIFTFYYESKRQALNEKFWVRSRYEMEKYVYRAERELVDNRLYLQITWWVPFVESYLKDVFDKMIAANKWRLKNDFLFWVINLFSSEFLTTIIKIIVWYSIFYNGASIGLMSMTILYVGNINWIIFTFMQIYLRTYINLKSDFQKFLTIFELSKEKKENNIIPKDIKKIEIANLDFRYPNVSREELKLYEIINERLIKLGEKRTDWGKRELHFIAEAIEDAKKENPQILNKANARFEKWKIYWIVWKNGAWKTTLINLLMWFFEEFEWKITYDSTELKDIKNIFFETNISYVSQNPYIMEMFTLRENLLVWVNREVKEEELSVLLKRFWLEDRIRSFRKWLDSEIGFDMELSGWQRQLIALIRAILQDRQIIVFDEWTNQLDAENEMLIMKELLKNKKDKIVIFITHRMTTIKKSDYIYCIESWRIADEWTHKDLLSRDSIYKTFWNTQVESGFE